MKPVITGVLVLFFVFAGLAAAQASSNQVGSANPAATTPQTPAIYEYPVRYQGRDGTLSVGEQEISFLATNAPKHSMAWNYNTVKKFETDPNKNEVRLVMHGGDVLVFKVTGNQLPTDEVRNAVAQRIAAAPKPPTHP
jgi:hypothetical protein